MLNGKKSIVILNKIDKPLVITKNKIEEYIDKQPIIEISALKNKGIEKIYDKITEIYDLGEISVDDTLIITNERHKQLIREIEENINKARKAIKQKMPIDVITINITNMLENIGNITGESVSEDVINEIFKKFCLGK